MLLPVLFIVLCYFSVYTVGLYFCHVSDSPVLYYCFIDTFNAGVLALVVQLCKFNLRAK